MRLRIVSRGSVFASFVLAAIASLAVALICHDAAYAAGRRLALVIGNSAYQHAPLLKNPSNDAEDLAAALEKLGFTVIRGVDLDKRAMDRTIQEFSTALHGADAGVFFYAGHGLQVNGVNYLVPTDAALASAAAPDFELVRLDVVQRSMERESRPTSCFSTPAATTRWRAILRAAWGRARQRSAADSRRWSPASAR